MSYADLPPLPLGSSHWEGPRQGEGVLPTQVEHMTSTHLLGSTTNLGSITSIDEESRD